MAGRPSPISNTAQGADKTVTAGGLIGSRIRTENLTYGRPALGWGSVISGIVNYS